MAVAPGAPTNLRYDKPTNENVDLVRWNPPSDNGGADITHYEYQRRAIGASTWEAAASTGSTSTSVNLNKPSWATGFEYQVRAVNSAGSGGWSNQIRIAGRPNTLGAMTATAATNRVAIELSWSAPATDGGKPITGYLVQWRVQPTDPNTNWGTTGAAGSRPVTGTSVTLTDADDSLAPGTTYSFRYRADNADRGSYFNVGNGSVAATTLDQATASVADGAADEGDAVSFTVTLSSTRTSNVTLNWATSDGTATAPADYTAQANGTVTVTAGQTTGTFTCRPPRTRWTKTMKPSRSP